MKKASFDLTGKAIDCRELPAMGEAGKEIFRALKVACNGVDNPEYAQFSTLSGAGFLACSIGSGSYVNHNNVSRRTQIIQPVDVLGQARIDAAKDGATLVFEEDVLPTDTKIQVYQSDVTIGYSPIIAYKLIEEKQPEIKSRILAEKVGASDVLTAGAKHLNDRAATYDSAEGERSMGATVEAFESITGHSLTEEQGWLFMVILKAVRSQQGSYKLDNYEDGAAYFALMAESASEARK